MPSRASVINSLLTKYNSQIEQNESGIIETAAFKFLICQLIDKDFGAGGGGGGGSTTPQVVSDGIDQSTDINTILTRLGSIDNKALLQSDIVAAIQSAADIDTIITRLSSIDSKSPTLPQRVQVAIDPNTSYPLDTGTIEILGLEIHYPTPSVCKLHLVTNGQITGIFNFRPVQSNGSWAHVLLEGRSTDLPAWIPLNSSLYNPQIQICNTYLTYTKTP